MKLLLLGSAFNLFFTHFLLKRYELFLFSLWRSLGCYLRNELKQGVGVQGANGQGYEVEQQPFVKGLLHERHHAGPSQGTQGDQRHTQDPIAPNLWAEGRHRKEGRRWEKREGVMHWELLYYLDIGIITGVNFFLKTLKEYRPVARTSLSRNKRLICLLKDRKILLPFICIQR